MTTTSTRSAELLLFITPPHRMPGSAVLTDHPTDTGRAAASDELRRPPAEAAWVLLCSGLWRQLVLKPVSLWPEPGDVFLRVVDHVLGAKRFIFLRGRYFYFLEFKQIGGSVSCMQDNFHPPTLPRSPRRHWQVERRRLIGEARQ